MYKTGAKSKSGDHSILVAEVIELNIGRYAGTIKLEAMESGLFDKGAFRRNITPRYRTMTLNCGVFSKGKRIRIKNSIFQIRKPLRSRAYKRWLRSHPEYRY